MTFVKKTKIISSIGPATWDEDKIIALYKAGVNMIRINFSHADYENTSRIVEIVQKLNANDTTKLALLGDLKGPEIRLGDYEGVKSYKKGDLFKIYIDKTRVLDGLDQFCDYTHLISDVAIGQVVRIESGIFDVLIKEKANEYLLVEALNDVAIKQRRHVNLPGTTIKLPGLIDQDKENILFCIKHNFDYIAMSFVRSAAHIQELRDMLHANGAGYIGIISKVENQEGLDHIEEITEASDGVMVARGDLGIEIDIALIPVRQRKIVKLCRKKGKFVIVATQLIESMMESPFPTRAEVSDVFNAVVQKADAVMTSGETALGKYPIQAIDMMKRIILQAEAAIEYKHEEFENGDFTQRDIEKKYLIRSAIEIAERNGMESLIVFTKTGKLAKMAAAYRPNLKIYAVTNRKSTFTATAVLFGVVSRYLTFQHHSEVLDETIKLMLKKGDIKPDERVVVVTDLRKDGKDTPVLEIVTVKDLLV